MNKYDMWDLWEWLQIETYGQMSSRISFSNISIGTFYK